MRAEDADRLIASSGDGDGALLYIYLLRRGAGPEAELCRALGWTAEGCAPPPPGCARSALSPAGRCPMGAASYPNTLPRTSCAARGRTPTSAASWPRLSGCSATRSPTQETKTLFGVYDFVGLPTDVMLVLLHTTAWKRPAGATAPAASRT